MATRSRLESTLGSRARARQVCSKRDTRPRELCATFAASFSATTLTTPSYPRLATLLHPYATESCRIEKERREFGADFRLVSTPSRHSIVAVFLRLIRVASDRSTILLLLLFSSSSSSAIGLKRIGFEVRRTRFTPRELPLRAPFC